MKRVELDLNKLEKEGDDKQLNDKESLEWQHSQMNPLRGKRQELDGSRKGVVTLGISI